MDEASVRTALNGFALGAKYANPEAKVQVIWADSWYDLDIESTNAETLINKGIKYMGMEASSPAIPQTCQENNAFCIGYNIDMEANAPKAVLTSFVWNWAPIFEDIMKKTADGSIEISANYYEGGECAALAELNDDLVPADVKAKVADLQKKIADGEVVVYGGELKNDKGEVLVEAGQVMSDEDILAQDFYVENVIGGK
jgi:basic membrane lipoprotein Med (substrate-binding protein (PBP1-ABC) superfamily)